MTLPPAERADAQARAWLDGDDAALASDGEELSGAELRAIGWALKVRCQQAWSSEPALACRAAAGARRLAALRSADPELAALADWTAGFAALVDGDMALALGRLRAAADGLEHLGQAALAAQARVPTLIALSMLGRNEEAADVADTLERALTANGDRLGAGKVALNRGSTLMRQDRYAEAAACYRRAAVAFARVQDLTHSVMADIGLAGALTWLHQFDQAEAMASRARQRAAAHELPVLEALALGELGQLQLHRGALGFALRAFERAVELLAGRSSPQRQLEAARARAEAYLAAGLWPETIAACRQLALEAESLAAPVEAAWSRTMLGQALAEAGDPGAARAELGAAAEAFSLLRNEVGVARCDLLLARMDSAGGDPDAAAGRARASACSLREAGLTRWRLEAELVLAQALLERGDGDAAQTLLDRVTADAGSADAPAMATCALLRARLAQGRADLGAARSHCSEAVQLYERLRLLVPSGDMRIAHGHHAEAADDLWVRLMDAGQPIELLRAIEQGRARQLRDDLARGLGARADDGPDDQALRSELNWLQRRWHQAVVAEQAEAGRLSSLQNELQAAESAWLRHRRMHAAARPAAGLGPAGIDLDELHERLGPTRRMLVYHLDDVHWRACVVGGGQCVRRAGRVERLPQRLASLQLQLDTMRLPGAELGRYAWQRHERITRVLRSLYDDLIAPLAGDLVGASQLIVVPHRALHGLPFAALAEAGDSQLVRAEWVMAQSAASWLHCDRLPRRGGSPVLVVGAGSSRLPAVAAEAAAVAAAWPGEAELMLDEAATIERWTSQAPRAGTLHIACHASARRDNPAFSSLHLHDGVVTLDEVASMRLRADLVVLSACDTAVSRLAPGDEVLGLARGFLLAGARTVVATLWSVPDASTAGLMAGFHAACRAGAGPAAALREAQRQGAQRRPHPFHWAAFVVHGAG